MTDVAAATMDKPVKKIKYGFEIKPPCTAKPTTRVKTQEETDAVQARHAGV
jgi:hypothetical protein